MKTANNEKTAYNMIPAVAALNKVPNFDPLRFLRKTKDGPKLDLKSKKLWFRLKYPTGIIRPVALKITDQLAIIEARVYFDKADKEPKAACIAKCDINSSAGRLYIAAAQHEAIDRALTDAGFGIQFIEMPEAAAEETTASATAVSSSPNVPAEEEKKAAAPAAPQKNEIPPAKQPEAAPPVVQEADFEEIVSEAPVEQAVEEATAETTTAVETAAEETVVEEPPVETAFTVNAAAVEVPAEEAAAEVQAADEQAVVEVVEEEPAVDDNGQPYTIHTPVDEICAVMSMEEAGNIIVPVGTCKGWTLSQVADRRPFSLKWYLNGYNGDDNILRAGAKMMLSAIDLDNLQKAG